MSVPSESRHKVRFGAFEVDLRTAELRTNGRELTLQGQPFQILIVLLECPGELVPREELKNRLWTSDTFVDFEHSLNKAVNRLREALNDSAEHPKFVETLPRKGYRWIGPEPQILTDLEPVRPTRMGRTSTGRAGLQTCDESNEKAEQAKPQVQAPCLSTRVKAGAENSGSSQFPRVVLLLPLP
jgi:DNA-binding winged helix-turn-helix (wHTH) protein